MWTHCYSEWQTLVHTLCILSRIFTPSQTPTYRQLHTTGWLCFPGFKLSWESDNPIIVVVCLSPWAPSFPGERRLNEIASHRKSPRLHHGMILIANNFWLVDTTHINNEELKISKCIHNNATEYQHHPWQLTKSQWVNLALMTEIR